MTDVRIQPYTFGTMKCITLYIRVSQFMMVEAFVYPDPRVEIHISKLMCLVNCALLSPLYYKEKGE